MDVEFCHWLQGERDQAHSQETGSIPTAGAGLKMGWAPQSDCCCSASPGLRPLTKPWSEARRRLHAFFREVKISFSSFIYVWFWGWESYFDICNSSGLVCFGQQNLIAVIINPTQRKCVTGVFIMFSKKLLRTRLGQPFQKNKHRKKCYKMEDKSQE